MTTGTRQKSAKKKKMPKTFNGKSTRPGGGGRFDMMVEAMSKKGMTRGRASAVAAAMGRKKYGAKKFAKMGAAGRKRAKKKAKK